MMIFNGFSNDLRPLIRCQVWKPDCPNHREVVALIDTGATDCIVRPALAAELYLPAGPSIHTDNVGVSGVKPSTFIDLLFTGIGPSGAEYSHAIQKPRTLIDQFDLIADIIIGMNVLCLFSVSIIAGVPQLRINA